MAQQHKNKRLIAGLATLCLSFSSTFASDRFHETSWPSAVVVESTTQVSLRSDTILSADIIKIKSPLYTNGHKLRLVARKVIFEGNGEIKGFLNPARPQTYVDRSLKGVSHTTEKAITGNEPHLIGREGSTGRHGHPGATDISPIIVTAQEVLGDVRIDGQGQKGGRGGQGGYGGAGADGRNGADAIAKAFCLKENVSLPAGDGSMPAPGGFGGHGGVGGVGGAPIPVSIEALTELPQTAMIYSRPGDGGEGGPAGILGFSGSPGLGGKSATHTKDCVFWNETVTAKAGDDGLLAVRIYPIAEQKKRRGPIGFMYAGEIRSSRRVSVNQAIQETYSKTLKEIIRLNIARNLLAAFEASSRYLFDSTDFKVDVKKPIGYPEVFIDSHTKVKAQMLYGAWKKSLNKAFFDKTGLPQKASMAPFLLKVLKSGDINDISAGRASNLGNGLISLFNLQVQQSANACKELKNMKKDTDYYSLLEIPACDSLVAIMKNYRSPLVLTKVLKAHIPYRGFSGMKRYPLYKGAHRGPSNQVEGLWAEIFPEMQEHQVFENNEIITKTKGFQSLVGTKKVLRELRLPSSEELSNIEGISDILQRIYDDSTIL